MLRKACIWILGFAKWVVLAGIILLALAAYNHFKGDSSHSIPPQSALATATGTVVAGREVTVEHKNPQGSPATEQYYELDLQPASGNDLIRLRFDHNLNKEALTSALHQQARILYDPSNSNMAYALRVQESDVISYTDLLALQQQRTRPTALGATGIWSVPIFLLLAGGIGMGIRRKLLRTADPSTAMSPHANYHRDDYQDSVSPMDYEDPDSTLISTQGRELSIDTQIGGSNDSQIGNSRYY